MRHDFHVVLCPLAPDPGGATVYVISSRYFLKHLAQHWIIYMMMKSISYTQIQNADVFLRVGWHLKTITDVAY